MSISTHGHVLEANDQTEFEKRFNSMNHFKQESETNKDAFDLDTNEALT